MKILITGGAGFIGAWLGKALHGRGDEVVTIDDFSSINYPAAIKEARVRELLKGVRVERMSILDFDALRRIFREVKPDIIVHFAAAPGVRYSSKEPRTYARVNVEGTTAVFEAAKQAEVSKVVYASSSSVYSMSQAMTFYEEENIMKVTSMYAATKRATELIADVYGHTAGIKSIGVRFFNVYGPWGRPDTVPYIFTDAILRHTPIDLQGNGEISRDFTYIRDIINGVIAIMNRYEESSDTIVNLGNASPIMLKDLVGRLEKLIGLEAIKKIDSKIPREDPINTYADITRAKAHYGWEPQVSMNEGLQEMVDWHRKYINGEYK